MSFTARAASPVKTRKARTAATVQASMIFVISGDVGDTLLNERVQRLVGSFGMPAGRARVIADLAWGGAA